MDKYIKTLEEKNDELQKRVAEYEQIAELRKFAGLHSKIGNAILVSVDQKISNAGLTANPIKIGNHFTSYQDETKVEVNLKFACYDDGSGIIEFIKELSNSSLFQR